MLSCSPTSVTPLGCALTNSLDLKSPEMNSYKKTWGVPSLPWRSSFANRCSSVSIRVAPLDTSLEDDLGGVVG